MSLAANIPNMTSQEINSLAKNKFITEDIQLAIANCDYRRGIENLSLNPNLCQDAIDVLWEKRGYVLKTNMIVSGAVKLNDSEVIDFYNRYYAKKRVGWRFIRTFHKGFKDRYKNHCLLWCAFYGRNGLYSVS